MHQKTTHAFLLSFYGEVLSFMSDVIPRSPLRRSHQSTRMCIPAGLRDWGVVAEHEEHDPKGKHQYHEDAEDKPSDFAG
jgi:hypothetical protein